MKQAVKAAIDRRISILVPFFEMSTMASSMFRLASKGVDRSLTFSRSKINILQNRALVTRHCGRAV